METIIDILIKIAALVFVAIIIPKLREFLTAKIDEKTLDEIILLIEKFVMAAEQEYKNVEKAGFDKKIYVKNHLIESGVELTDEVDALIEAAVYGSLY